MSLDADPAPAHALLLVSHRLPAWQKSSGKSRITACTWRRSRRTMRSPSKTCRPRWRKLSSWLWKEESAQSWSWKPGWGQHWAGLGERYGQAGVGRRSFPKKHAQHLMRLFQSWERKGNWGNSSNFFIHRSPLLLLSLSSSPEFP